MSEATELHPPGGLSRRTTLKALAGLGVGSAVFQRAVAALADEEGGVTPEMIRQAEWIAGLNLSDEDRASTAKAVERSLASFKAVREISLDNGVPPAVTFHPAPWLPPAEQLPRGELSLIESSAAERPAAADELAFLPVSELAPLVRTRQVSSLELTRLYLERLRKFDPLLKCVVNYTEELALEQAEQADREIAAGRYRGPLHGIPWGAKDLIAYPGYPTTWGAPHLKDQVLDTKATVAQRLEDAGAVLVAKLSLGALAQGDQWFGGQTKCPWSPKLGSSGSSAGSAAAAAAGLVGFAIGSETYGSIVSPCRRCGATGLRPTFGRVSRQGCMTLSWTMDKLGPIARSVEDCALVLGAIHGRDGLDPAAVDRPFPWPLKREIRSLRVGYVESEKSTDEREELRVLKELGVQLVPITLPETYPADRLLTILGTEAAAVFDELTRAGITEGLNSWPMTFRQGEFVPAVEYLRANRVRTLIMREMESVMSQIDAYVEGEDSALTNLTGHPCVILPDGFRKVGDFELPLALKFTGKLYGEAELLALAHAYQQATGFHLQHPPLERLLAESAEG
jgi:Asp-tRNA(Asn)/Glu-tRNA(Gln) amidotransferase A subunit family amidase